MYSWGPALAHVGYHTITAKFIIHPLYTQVYEDPPSPTRHFDGERALRWVTDRSAPPRRALLAKMRAPIKMVQDAAGGACGGAPAGPGPAVTRAVDRVDPLVGLARGADVWSSAPQDPAPALVAGGPVWPSFMEAEWQDAQVRPGGASRRLLCACGHGVDPSSCRGQR